MKRILAIILISIFVIFTKAQSIHHSQFFSSPLLLNPAYTGQIDGNMRFTSLYRSQGTQMSEPLKAFSCSFDKPVVFKESQVGIGFTYSNEYANGNTLSSHMFNLSIGSGIMISERSGIGLGLQFGYALKSVNSNNLSFPSQYDRDIGMHNYTLNSNESFINTSNNHFNINAGTVWNYSGSKFLFSTGVAFFGLNNASYNFLEITEKIKTRTNWHGTLKYKLNNVISLTPQSLITYQNKASAVTLGSNVSFALSSTNYKKSSFTIGAYNRSNLDYGINTLVLTSGYTNNNWTVYLGYDVDISSSTQNIFSNALELSVVYELSDLILNKTIVPWIRY